MESTRPSFHVEFQKKKSIRKLNPTFTETCTLVLLCTNVKCDNDVLLGSAIIDHAVELVTESCEDHKGLPGVNLFNVSDTQGPYASSTHETRL